MIEQVKKNNALDMILNSDLRALGSVATKVITTLNNQPDAGDIEDIILKDAALTAQIIRIANTSKTERDKQRNSLQEAIVRVGYDGIRSICICIGIVENIPVRNAFQKGLILDCLRRCFETAIHADNLVKKISDTQNKDAYIAGLLCNIGELAFISSPIVNLVEYKELQNVGLTPEQACLSLCGCDYDELSEQIVEKWELSPFINDAFNSKPASNTGKAIKMAFELTRAFHSGQNSKAFIEVSKQLVREFKLSFKESVSFIEKGIQHAQSEFKQYEPMLQKKTGGFTSTSRHANFSSHTAELEPMASAAMGREVDWKGLERALDKFSELGQTTAATKIYCSILSDALYNYAAFERVVISEVKNTIELKAIALSGPNTQGLGKNFSFSFVFGESLISEIISTRQAFHYSERTSAEDFAFIDQNIKQAVTKEQEFYLCPIVQQEQVIAVAFMDMGSKRLAIAEAQLKAANILMDGVKSAINKTSATI